MRDGERIMPAPTAMLSCHGALAQLNLFRSHASAQYQSPKHCIPPVPNTIGALEPRVTNHLAIDGCLVTARRRQQEYACNVRL